VPGFSTIGAAFAAWFWRGISKPASLTSSLCKSYSKTSSEHLELPKFAFQTLARYMSQWTICVSALFLDTTATAVRLVHLKLRIVTRPNAHICRLQVGPMLSRRHRISIRRCCSCRMTITIFK
jgi:hypothetical protein